MAGGAEQSTIPGANNSQFLLSFLRERKRYNYSVVFNKFATWENEKKEKEKEKERTTFAHPSEYMKG
jgi:hypothetical protein